jgi:hypothetical protein
MIDCSGGAQVGAPTDREHHSQHLGTRHLGTGAIASRAAPVPRCRARCGALGAAT